GRQPARRPRHDPLASPRVQDRPLGDPRRRRGSRPLCRAARRFQLIPGRNPRTTWRHQSGAMKRTLLAVAVTLALGACAGSPRGDLALTAEVPPLAPSASSAIQSISIDRWWTLFGDPALERLIDESLAHNADLESAVARVREAQASLGVVRAAQSPTLDAKAGSSRNHQAGQTYSSHRAALEAGYEVDLWGKLASSSAAARHQLLATEWARAALEWSLTASVAEAYFELAAVERQIEISQAVRASRASTALLRQREFA